MSENAVGLPLIAIALLAVCVAGLAVRRLVRAARRERTGRMESERALRRVMTLEALAHALSRAQSPSDVAQACLSELLSAFGATAGAVAIVNDEERRLDVV